MSTLTFCPEQPWLAPLAGYSDLAFRMLCREQGCAVTVTEMVSVKGLVYGGHNTKRLLETHPTDTPCVLQLFGSEPEFFSQAMDLILASNHFSYFDLNAGCPVRKVTKTGAGARLLETPKRLLAIAQIMVNKAGKEKVGVKTRLGWALNDEIFLDIAKELQSIGVAWITLHPRYGRQLFTGKADWTKIQNLKENINIPIIASGDLYTAQDGIDCLKQTGVDAIMFARGALYDPTIFYRFKALYKGETLLPRSGHELAQIITRHIELTRAIMGDQRSFRHIRSLLPRYAKGLHNIRELRQALLACNTWEELLAQASEIAELQAIQTT